MNTLMCIMILRLNPFHNDSSLADPYDWSDVLSKLGVCIDKNTINDVSIKTRYISVEKPLVLPAHTRILAIVSSSDVIHSWAVPELGIKIDACPDRINTLSFQIDIDSRIYQAKMRSKAFSTIAEAFARAGKINEMPFFGYYGQCSEFCGVGHGFMPIVVHAINKSDFTVFFPLIWILPDYITL